MNDSIDTDQSATTAMLQMIAGFRTARAIYVAAKAGIADLLANKPLEISYDSVLGETSRCARRFHPLSLIR